MHIVVFLQHVLKKDYKIIIFYYVDYVALSMSL